MEAVLIRPHDSDEDTWFRSVIVDFTPDQELVIVIPRAKDEVSAEAVEHGAVEPVSPESNADAETEQQADGDGANGQESDAREAEDQDVDDEDLDDRSFLFDRGTRLDVEISFPDGIRRFSSVVRKLDLRFGGALRIDWPTDGTRIQRRDFVRVEASYPTTVRYTDAETGALQKLTGATMDLSAGGVRLRLPQPLPAESAIEIEIETGPLKGRSLAGRVVRSGEIATRNPQPNPDFWVAVEFTQVDAGLRKDMTQIVFEIQRDRMRKSLN